MRRDAFRDVTLPGKMFDFIAMGKPVLSSRTRSVEQTFDASCVEGFESGNPADLAAVIRRLAREPERGVGWPGGRPRWRRRTSGPGNGRSTPAWSGGCWSGGGLSVAAESATRPLR
jgi:hypothetical protein